jgi:hypothetical protein
MRLVKPALTIATLIVIAIVLAVVFVVGQLTGRAQARGRLGEVLDRRDVTPASPAHQYVRSGESFVVPSGYTLVLWSLDFDRTQQTDDAHPVALDGIPLRTPAVGSQWHEAVRVDPGVRVTVSHPEPCAYLLTGFLERLD